QMTGPQALDLQVRALGEIGLRNCPDWRDTGMPRVSLLASPAIWRDNELIAAPLAGFPNGWRAELAQSAADFAQSLISH
ncbi:MAG: tRNA(Ile)-lysidine synthetase, partial [Rhodobacter sp.]|nr:tRNA(Ile)-lysidine synthetase [Rhodobacter sp.]